MHLFTADIQYQFKSRVNSYNAEKMSAYMKNRFVFFGIKSPERMAVLKPWLDEMKTLSIEEKFQIIHELWGLEEREFQMAALEVLRGIKLKEWKPELIEQLEYLIVTKSWWDSVDLIASSAVGSYFQAFPEKIEETINNWSNSQNMWLQRSTLIFQLKYKADVDFELLTSLIIKYQNDNQFFIQKAIGWSLRQYSKFNPDTVIELLPKLSISNLAKREASKYL